MLMLCPSFKAIKSYTILNLTPPLMLTKFLAGHAPSAERKEGQCMVKGFRLNKNSNMAVYLF